MIFGLIGGKSNKGILTNKIEKHLVSLIDHKPTILYCPYAQINNIEKSISRFHDLVSDIDCDIIDLRLDNISLFEEYLIKCDIFYVGGGCCDDLVQFFKDNGLDKILFNHINDNKIFAGTSAGAMLLTKSSMGDKYMYSDNFGNHNYKMVDCLGLLDITISPHYQNEDLIVYNDELKKYNCDGFGIEEDTMLVINDNKFYVIKESNNLSLYHFDKDRDYLMIPLYEGVVYEKNCSFRTSRNIL